MRRLSIEAATPESGLALFDALSAFKPHIQFTNGTDPCVVSVRLGGEGRSVEVLATLGEFLQKRPVGTPVTMTIIQEAERTAWSASDRWSSP